eukprot:CAMPEP_0202717688 /NCGR_PEP_ID=MMETSP1385-20130828/114106_1 /ASSEMBLY_ACC=CAM_ASM_000861 /TAXON_ID=933848 /ORGANISM="Elphidium margaritaceum" /LENGTH=175 /DNA_ID=CAMNT_0049380033 /DNA_START=68 /DNA_END=592 /DNA_ORIENTATION=-
MSSLTLEQKQRIEANRLRALKRKQQYEHQLCGHAKKQRISNVEKAVTNTASYHTVPSTSSSDVSKIIGGLANMVRDNNRAITQLQSSLTTLTNTIVEMQSATLAVLSRIEIGMAREPLVEESGTGADLQDVDLQDVDLYEEDENETSDHDNMDEDDEKYLKEIAIDQQENESEYI